jgi:hypothetical protein
MLQLLALWAPRALLAKVLPPARLPLAKPAVTATAAAFDGKHQKARDPLLRQPVPLQLLAL